MMFSFGKKNEPDPKPADKQGPLTSQERAILETIRWGPTLLPLAEQAQHCAAIGSTGSGKTTLLRLAMQDLIPAIGPGTDSRAIVYNAKQDLLPLLSAMAPQTPILNMDPLDERGVAWDIAGDVTEPAVAIELACTLISQTNESQPFFADACRHLSYGVMLSFMERRIPWTLADLLRSFSTPNLLRRVLLASKYTRTLVPRYFQDERLLSNILSTFATKMMPFEPLAAAWEHAQRKVSVNDWINGEFVIVLGNNETSKHSINTINRCIFKRACDLAINQEESATRRSWFIVDELPEIGKLDGLLSLSKKGRSKGACLVVAFQSVAGLRSSKLYGKEETAEILDQMGHFAIGRVGLDTAEWASQLIGEQEIREVTVNYSFGSSVSGGSNSSTSFNEVFKTRKAVLASQLMGITPCSLESGLTAYYLSRTEKAVTLENIPGHALFKRDLMPPDPSTAAFIPRPSSMQLLEPWTREQRRRFAPQPIRRKRRTDKSRRLELPEKQGGFENVLAAIEQFS